MKAQYIKHKKQWSAFMTINGLDVQEYGDTEKQARENLANRIANSKFLSEGIKIKETPKVGDTVIVQRQIGKNGTPHSVEGTIKRFSKTILVDGEQTVWVDFVDGDGYWYPISKVVLKSAVAGI